MNKNISLADYLYQFMLKERSDAYKRALQNRTSYITLILEDLFQHQNYSAVLRSSECFGIQDIYVVENRNKFLLNPDVVMGANKWLTINQYSVTPENKLADFVHSIKSKGYRIIGTTPNPDATPINQLNISSSPIAVVFGTELTGLSPEMSSLVDEMVTIPMYGLTASLNISVSAAIVLQDLTFRLRNEVEKWQLSPNELNKLEIEWLTKSLKKSDLLIKNFNDLKHHQ